MTQSLFSIALGKVSTRTFLKELISNPRSIGAACPSSPYLARKMASLVPLSIQGKVVELGPGTGVVTRALLHRGIPAKQIVAVELSHDLVHHLQTHFPDITVIQGDASHLHSLLDQHFGDQPHQVDAVVSSLPLKSIPTEVVKKITEEVNRLVSPEGRVIQFTYDLRRDAPCPFPEFKTRDSTIVWRNIPPARVSWYERLTHDESRRTSIIPSLAKP